MIVVFLAILCIQLIYSLMLSDVEGKTFEFGMLRALGFNTKNLMITIILQALSFAIPGLFMGLVMAASLNGGLRDVLFTLAGNSSTYMLSVSSICIGVALGILLPLLSNIIPIQRALGKNLRASLDLYHRSIGELTIQIKSLKDMGLSVNQLIVALLLVVMGVLTYYVAPTAFFFKHYGIFFGILNAVLLQMIIGLTLLSILILSALQRLFLESFLCCCKRDRKLK